MLDNIYCITLDKRIQQTSIDIDLEKIGYKVNLYKVGDGVTMPPSWYDYVDEKVEGRAQAWNYGKVLLNLFSIAKSKGFEDILILEDDAIVNDRYKDNFKFALEETMKQLRSIENWDCLYLGGNIQEATELERPTQNIYKPNYLLDMQAVLWNKRAYNKILSINPSREATIDGIIAELIRNKKLNAYCVLPVLITQQDNFSYNENRNVSRKQNHIL